MRLSIWQQFSSNHSGFFWVVGTFKTVEAARQAYDELRNMLMEIDRWHRENPMAMKTANESGNYAPFPIEAKFAEKYGVEWKTTIDWTGWANYFLEGHPRYLNYNPQESAARLIDKTLQIVGKNVVAEAPDQTWMTTQPFEGILQHLGAETMGYDLESSENSEAELFTLHNRLTFNAPDLKTAAQIETAIRTYLSGELVAQDNLPPWHDDISNYAKVLPTSHLLSREYIDILQKNWQKHNDFSGKVPKSPSLQKLPIRKLTLVSRNARIERDNLFIRLQDLWFELPALGMSALIAYLEAQGCTDIDFQYTRNLDGEGS